MLHAFIHLFHYIKNVICVCACVCVLVAGHTTRLTGQSVGVSSLHHVSLSFRDWTHITSFGSKHLTHWASCHPWKAFLPSLLWGLWFSSYSPFFLGVFDIFLLECLRTWSWGLISFLALCSAQSCNLVTQPRAGLLKDFANSTLFCPINHEEIF